MNITLKNIGTLNEATFNLDKDLIIFIGPNNTGKTYAAYCLYGLWKQLVNWSNVIIDQIFLDSMSDLFEYGSIKIDLKYLFNERSFDIVINELCANLKNTLPSLFALSTNHFDNSSFELDFDYAKFSKYLTDFQFGLSEAAYGSNIVVSYDKPLKSSILTLKYENKSTNTDIVSSKDFVSLHTKRNIINFVIKSYYQKTIYFITAERIGISIFSKDLFTSRFTRTNEILSLNDTDRIQIVNLMTKEFNQYSTVIQYALNEQENFIKQKEVGNNSNFYKLAEELETKILKGKVTTNTDGDILFEIDNKSIKVQSAGSIVKSLASLVQYLKFSIDTNQVLIIDEPEINLHPDNQRLVARILAKLSKLGVKVIVSTHSDYFIKELNNLIMLNKDHPDTAALREKYGYNESEILDDKKVGAYLFKDNKATELEVTPVGMEAATIDEEINKLNNTATDIYWTLFEN